MADTHYLCSSMDNREKQIYRVTLVGSLVNAVLIALKFVAGILGRSSAMVADAVHSLSDFVTDVIVLAFVKIASKPRDESHDYGHGKFETLATLIIGVILIAAGIALLINGISLVVRSLHGEELPRPGAIALVVAVVSILSKEWLFRYTLRAGKSLNSSAVRANAWHHRSDAISSGGTLVGIAGAMFLGDNWRILDPLAAIVVSFFIVKSGYDIVRPAAGELLERSLPDEQEQEIERLVLGVQGIDSVHKLRTRRIGNTIAVDMHAHMPGQISLAQAHTLATEAENAIRDRFGKDCFINIHMEPTSVSKCSSAGAH